MAGSLILEVFGPTVKWIVLNWGFTTNVPLEKTLRTELTLDDLKKLDVPTYVSLSRFHPEVRESRQWGGWVPDYVRLDQLPPASVHEVLLQSAGLPGIFPVKIVLGEEAIDGGLCDNLPLAPLLYDMPEALDLIFVIYLDERGRRLEKSWFGFYKKESFASDSDEPEFYRIEFEAAENWRASQEAIRHRVAWYEQGRPDSDSTLPRMPAYLIDVVPSKPLGNFLTGTLWFSAGKAKRLMKLGEADMKSIIERLIRGEFKS
jgi:predicted acylesterase/phospholipase RssA